MYSLIEPRFRTAVCAVLLFFVGVASSTHAIAADRRPMKIEDLFAFKRVSGPRISPDGKQVVYSVGSVDLEKNKSTIALWIVATDGKTPPKQLTKPEEGQKHTGPRWSPDGMRILFEAGGQLWVVAVEGGEPRQITNIATGASSGIWSPDGSHIAFVSSVYPEFSEKPFAESDKLNKVKDDEKEKSPVKAKVFTKLFFRHWDHYVDGKREHIFVLRVGYAKHESPSAPDELQKATPHNVTPGDRDAVPTSSTFSSGDDFTFTPDNKYVLFTAVPEKNEAWSTNYEICRVTITNSSPKWETLTADNPAADSGPQFRADGKQLAWRAQKKPGYEADKWDIVVADVRPDGTLTGKPVPLFPEVDLSCNEFTWVSGLGLAFTVDENGATALYHVDHGRKPLRQSLPGFGGFIGSLSAPSKVADLGCTYASMNAPAEVGFISFWQKNPETAGPVARSLSRANTELLAQLDLPKPESVEVPVEGGVKMQMWILKPPGFDPKKKWPVVYLIHGGPQGAWSDSWSFRWNPQIWAAQGYVIAMPNPRGSTGFGQKFTDEISGDWGGKCYRDLVAGIEFVEKLPFVDINRLATAGASFGGYMQNWFAVNEIAKKFKCQVNHCSVWNFESMWGTTEELWFDEYEHGGLPWEVPGKYAEFSPHKKAVNMAKYKVPMLVIHNDLDFRCPIGQGHELFTTLQRLGVPSRMVNFPDEGHWVVKPRNSQYWHQEVFAWLKAYAPPGGK